MLEWWLYSKTQLPDDPVEIAKQCNWGNDQLAKVTVITHNENQADHETGRPALYDNGIGTDYQHNIGIRKGRVGR
ncbi:IS1249 family transposase [Corynebacterium diphtheriae]|nr:IS1249 family transposase [Corynebacterium diphtheriae]CAB0672002.1 IS1249 family transposase [Corynebacterium diphtheriae]CAB0938813.1 IS1249 family transposase [Corynebacterium diphtheriae]